MEDGSHGVLRSGPVTFAVGLLGPCSTKPLFRSSFVHFVSFCSISSFPVRKSLPKRAAIEAAQLPPHVLRPVIDLHTTLKKKSTSKNSIHPFRSNLLIPSIASTTNCQSISGENGVNHLTTTDGVWTPLVIKKFCIRRKSQAVHDGGGQILGNDAA